MFRKLVYHLCYNFYPRRNLELVPVCLEAISLINQGKGDQFLSEVEDANTKKPVTANEFAEELRLWEFTDDTWNTEQAIEPGAAS